MAGETPEYYLEVRLEVPHTSADAVCNYIIDNITGGLVLEEEEDSPVTGILFYISPDEAQEYRSGLTEYLNEVFADGSGAVPEITEKTIRNIEWVDEYRKSVRPLRIADDVVVRPTWDVSPAPAKYEIVLEPKMAFGTGSHETTRSCLKVIRQAFKPGMRFLDLGCGSGILSVLASKMGAEYILAIDCDVTAVENCRENFQINDVSTPHDIVFGSVEKADAAGRFDFVCVNIIKSVILPIVDRLVRLTDKGGVLALSGLLPPDETEITEALRENGQDNFTIMRDNQWLTYIVQKK